uniref:F-box/kelch-repeat protein n=1 Tax=Hymenolepis diminuta TaxID=6216 RepID=A0A0R3SJC5_HYMDI
LCLSHFVFRSHERLTTFVSIENATQVWILNRECSAVEIELQLRGRKCTTVFTFQDKLVFMGGWQSENVTGSRNVDLMDISTGQVSSIPDMIKARNSPVGVATENEIFAICNRWPSDSPSRFSNEVYETFKRVKEFLPPSRWSLLPLMIEERTRCAAVNIPDYGILVIGGIGWNGSPLRSTELLTRRSGEVGGGGGEKWQWLPYTPMNKEHCGDPLAVYYQGRVYVVGWVEQMCMMEMLDVAAGGQWTSLNFFRQNLKIYSMACVGNELFASSIIRKQTDQLKIYFKEETEVSEFWSAASATKNEDLIIVCSILVTMKWEMLKTSGVFHVNAEIKGMMSLLGCPRMTQKSETPKVEALFE